MPRRVRMPAADELFRPTGPLRSGAGSGPQAAGSAALASRPQADRLRAVPDPVEDDGAAPDAQAQITAPSRPGVRSGLVGPTRGASGRERHDEKITVYVSPEELLGLERARILLRAEHALAVDRGRIVREAIDLILADFDANGESSMLVDCLRYRRN